MHGWVSPHYRYLAVTNGSDDGRGETLPRRSTSVRLSAQRVTRCRGSSQPASESNTRASTESGAPSGRARSRRVTTIAVRKDCEQRQPCASTPPPFNGPMLTSKRGSLNTLGPYVAFPRSRRPQASRSSTKAAVEQAQAHTKRLEPIIHQCLETVCAPHQNPIALELIRSPRAECQSSSITTELRT